MKKRDCLNKYAEECVRLSKQERTEVLWLKNIYDRFRKEMGDTKSGIAFATISRSSAVVNVPSGILQLSFVRSFEIIY